MAKANIPWSIKGIDPDMRAVAKEKAKEAGMTLGEWMSQTILNVDADPATTAASSESSDATPSAEIATPIQRSAITVEHLKALVESVNRLNDRIQVTERNSRETANGLNLGLTSVMERIKKIETKGGDVASASASLSASSSGEARASIDTLKSLETALRQVVDQFETTSAQTMERMTTNEQAVSRIAQRMDRMDSETNAAFIQMRRAIDTVNAQIVQTERTAKAVMLEARAASQSTDSEFVEQTGQKLRILGGEIKRSGDQIQALEKLIHKLSAKIEASEHRSSEGISRVASTLEGLRQELGNFDHGEEEGERLEAETAIAAASEAASSRMDQLQTSFNHMIARLEGVVEGKSAADTKSNSKSVSLESMPVATAKSAPIATQSSPEATQEEDTLKSAMSATDDMLSLDDDEEFETIFGDPISPDNSEEARLVAKPTQYEEDDAEKFLSALVDDEDNKPVKKTRRDLTAKEKVILAARARKKRLEAQALQDEALDDESEEAIAPVKSRSGKSDAQTDRLPSDSDERESRFEAMRRRYGNRDGSSIMSIGAWLAAGAALALLVFVGFWIKDQFFTAKPPVTRVENTTPATTTSPVSESISTIENPTTTTPASVPTGTDLVQAQTLYTQGMQLLGDEATLEAQQAGFTSIRQAAAKNYPPAEYQLGELFLTGTGTPRSEAAARRWFQTAAEHGTVIAMHKLGAMNANGYGGERNAAAARYWFEEAAQHGAVDSMFNLGLMFIPEALLQPGETLDPTAVTDPAKAYFWLTLAGTKGDQEAAAEADNIGASLPAETKQRVDAQIAAWVPRQPDAVANAIIAP